MEELTSGSLSASEARRRGRLERPARSPMRHGHGTAAGAPMGRAASESSTTGSVYSSASP